MRGLVLSVAVLAAVMMAGCAKQSPTLARVGGSEPQRLSFGPPRAVQQVFLDKMKLCWLSAPGGLLAGYRYDTSPALTDGSGPLEQITILNSTSRGIEAFAVEFHAFNDNTLIATRNRGFPPPLAAQLKRDVETWIIESPGCAAPEDLAGTVPPYASGGGRPLPDSSLKAQLLANERPGRSGW